jgi:Trypsin-co-occurring domain 1
LEPKVTRLIEIPLKAGGTLLVEIATAESSARRGLSSSDIAVKATRTFEEALDKIRPAADALISNLKQLAVSPNEIGIEFGLKITADAKAYVASASAEANFKIALKWTRDGSAN